MDFRKLNRALKEALDNYSDADKWVDLLADLEEKYKRGFRTEAYLEICKFFKYDDLVATFQRLVDYRNEHNGYDIDAPEYEEQYLAFQTMIHRLEKEIPNEFDFEELESLL